MNLFADIKTLVLDSLAELQAEGALPEGLDLANVAVEPPRDALHGDMATNAAMVLAKPARLKPRDIAEALAVKLVADWRINAADVAGPGFLNLTLAPKVWLEVVTDALNSGYDGIVLMGCRKDDDYQCHFVRGSRLAGVRMSKIDDTLEQLNLEPDRVATYEVAITDVERAPKLINDMAETVERVGMSPFKF